MGNLTEYSTIVEAMDAVDAAIEGDEFHLTRYAVIFERPWGKFVGYASMQSAPIPAERWTYGSRIVAERFKRYGDWDDWRIEQNPDKWGGIAGEALKAYNATRGGNDGS